MANPPQPFTSFSSLIDSRLLRSLSSSGFTHPTPIQSHVFPLAISENRDILARAKTGSGKTLAYGVPLVQKILKARSRLQEGYRDTEYLKTRALVLVPTRELAEQVSTHLRGLSEFLLDKDAVRVVNVAGQGVEKGKGKSSSDKVQKMHLSEKPDIVVSTPSRALIHLRSGGLDLSSLECLVIDEADLILSYGHSSSDIRSILSGGPTPNWTLPTIYQSFLMSATLTTEIDQLKDVVLRNPATIKLSDSESNNNTSNTGTGSSNLTQYVIRTTEDDKFLLIYVILKLKLVKGKILIFVNDTDRGYRLKLFLEKFGIRSGVLNAELPFNSRYHAVQEFNRGVFNYLIATDESGLEGVEKDEEEEDEEEAGNEVTVGVEGGGAGAGDGLISTQIGGEGEAEPEGEGEAEAEGEGETSASTSSKKRKATAKETSKNKKRKSTTRSNGAAASEYGVTRGIDFVDVSCVINFDLPTSSRSYTHRIGRTARAGRSGMSMSFVVPKSAHGKSSSGTTGGSGGGGRFDTSLSSTKRDEKVWKRIERDQKLNNGVVMGSESSSSLKEYRFDMDQVEGFRYRMEDGLRSVTRSVVREARIREIKNEVLNSDKLKAHFEDNPRDLAFLRHDKPLQTARVQPHMKHVPSYLMPRIAPVDGPSTSNSTGNSALGEQDGQGNSSAIGPAGKEGAGKGGKERYVPYTKNKASGAGRGGKGAGRGGRGGGGRGGSSRGGKKDPLKSFKRK